MNTQSKLGLIVAMTLSAAMLAPLPASAGNPHWGEQQLELSRAKHLRAQCVDANGRCIESKMLADNTQYRCPMHKLQVMDASGMQSGVVSTMFCE